MPYWKPLIVEGRIVDLSHLEPLEFRIVPSGWTEPATIRATFNNHCFSSEFDPARHTEALSARHAPPHERRAFDSVRYALSRKLPLHIEGLDGQRIARTRTSVLVRIAIEGGDDYAIFFNLRRESPQRCDLFVISAYPLSRARHRVAATGEMKFNLAVGRVLEGKPLKFPPARR